MAERKRRRRRAYLEDFKKTASGEYIYTGAHYAWNSSRTPVLLRLWGMCAAVAAAGLAGGCLPGVQMDNGRPYVLLPYVAALLGAFSQVWAMCRLTAGGDPMRAYVYQASIQALPGRAVLTAVFAGIAIPGQLVNMIFTSFSGSILFSILFMVLEGVVLAGSLLLRRTIIRLKWTRKS